MKIEMTKFSTLEEWLDIQHQEYEEYLNEKYVGGIISLTVLVATLLNRGYNWKVGKTLQNLLNNASPEEINKLKEDFGLDNDDISNLKNMSAMNAGKMKRSLDRMKKMVVKYSPNTKGIGYMGDISRLMDQYAYQNRHKHVKR